MELLIARYPWCVFNVLLDNKKNIVEIQTCDADHTDIGTIYVGRVEQVKKNINSAFIRISDGEKVFLSLQEDNPIFYVKKVGKKSPIVQGDELLVQIEKAAHKSKLAKVTSAFTLSGRYAVLTTDKQKIFVSSKVEDGQKVAFKSKLRSYVTDHYGFIIRTNAMHVPLEAVEEELTELGQQYEAIVSHLPYKQVYQCLHKPEAKYLAMIRDLSAEDVLTITVCEDQLGQEVEGYLEANGIEGSLNVLNETTDGLLNLYGIKDQLNKVMRPKVWLKSGATIVVEPTEAMVVIDVNTEKTLSRKASDQTILKTNLEAAEMIVRQMRLRNMSGIIIIDFIDMKTSDHKDKVMSHLSMLCESASLKTTVHGMTSLGLVEVTRKKLEKPIWENTHIQKLLS